MARRTPRKKKKKKSNFYIYFSKCTKKSIKMVKDLYFISGL